jgi:hypothetical protein
LVFLNNLRIALLAAWLGIAIYFSAAVAPSAFKVLRSFSVANPAEIAGSIVTRTLFVVNVSGVLVSLLLLVTVLIVRERLPRWVIVSQSLLLIVVAVATSAGEWIIASRMRGLRLAMHGQIDQLPVTDPNRMAFAALHGYSVAALSIAIIAGLIALLIMAGISCRTERNTAVGNL